MNTRSKSILTKNPLCIWSWFLYFFFFPLAVQAVSVPDINVEQQKVEVQKYHSQIFNFIRHFNKKLDSSTGHKIAHYVLHYSAKKGMDPFLITALIAKESGFNPRAVSSSQAMGLGQLKEFHFEKYGLNDPYAIDQNIQACVTLLSELRYAWKTKHGQGSPYSFDQLMLSSYLQGFGATQRSKTELPDHVLQYIQKIYKYREQIITGV